MYKTVLIRSLNPNLKKKKTPAIKRIEKKEEKKKQVMPDTKMLTSKGEIANSTENGEIQRSKF